MKTTLIALGALLISAGAYAQEAINLNGVSIRLGMAFPLDNTLQSANDNFTSIGLEFASPSSIAKGTDSYLSLDYFSKSLGTFGKGSVIPVAYNVRFYQKGMTARQSYAFVGAGFAIVDINGGSETVAMARGGFGMNISDHAFVEAAGTFSAATNNSGSFNTIGFYVGYRF